MDMLSELNRYGLKHSSNRPFSLLGISCVAKGYIEILQEIANYSYKAMGVYVKGKDANFMFNDEQLGNDVEKNVDSEKKIRDLIELSKEYKEEIEIVLKSKTPMITRLKKILEIYPKNFAAIGIYTSFRRSLGNSKSRGALTPELLKELGKKQEEIKYFSPVLEIELTKICMEAGKELGIISDNLLYCTIDEVKSFLDKKTTANETNKLAEARKNSYFYFYNIDKKIEHIFIDEQVISKIVEKHYAKNNEDPKSLSGHIAYKGLVEGYVFIPKPFQKYEELKKDTILVTSMTNPTQIEFMKNSKGIVTDEGGVLSHAAIVSRELKKPCIIGTKHATKTLKNGDFVQVDANKGVVKKLS